MTVKERDVADLPGVVAAVLEIRASLGSNAFLWFRGVPCRELSLLPKLLRYNRTTKEVFDRERRLLTRFRQRSMAYWPAGYPQNNWEQMFAMQHYGMPTRLLDWSENLLVATYFSLLPPPQHQHATGSCHPVVWCTDPVGWNRAMPVLQEYGDEIHVLTTADEELEAYEPETKKRRSKSPVAVFGSHNSQRIVAQRGTFMVWGEDVKPLEEVADDHKEVLLWRLSLTGDREYLRQDLETLGFSETMVFPELQSLAEELDRTEGWRS